MKRSKIELAKELVITQMNHWFYISIALTALGLFNCEKPYFLLCACLGVLPVYEYFLRERMKVFPLFLLLSAAPMLLGIAAPVSDIAVRALLIVFGLYYSVYSIYLRTRGNDGLDVPVSPVVAFCAEGGLFLLLSSQRETQWDKYFIFCALVYFACFLIQYFLVHFLTFITVNDSSASNIPERAIFQTGMKQTLLFTGAVTVFLMLVAGVDWLAGILSALKTAIVAFISKYLQFTPEQSETTESWSQPLEGGGFDFFDSTGEPALIWVILEYIAIVAVLGGILFAVCYGIYKALLNGFQRERRGKEQRLAENDDIHEQVELAHKERKVSKSLWEAFSVTERIRRAYRKRVEKERYMLVKDGDLQALSFLTPKECCDRMEAPGLKAAYEKARYSNTNCTNEDLKLTKG